MLQRYELPLNMESSKASKKGRSRSKSISADSQPGLDEEMAPNLNGNKDGGDEPETNVEIKQEIKDEPKGDSPVKTRKRKAIDFRSDDSATEDTPKKDYDDDTAKDAVSEKYSEQEKETPADTSMDVDNRVDDENNSTNDSEIKDISVNDPSKSLGKGKRARVPNKRYSDITPLKDSHKSKSTENGQLAETPEIHKEESESDTPITSKKSSVNIASPAGPVLKKHKTSVDLTNPNFLKPFQYGWKRELVYRANTDNSLKRNGDIYYYTPAGKKVRSMREVAEHLKNKELSIDDFTFFKEPLGIEDPEKEIIRDAKFKTNASIPVVKKMTPKLVKTPKSTSPKSTTTAGDTPKSVKSPRGFKVKLPRANSAKKEKKKGEESDMEIGTYPPNWTSPAKKGKVSNFEDNKPCRPCSIRCEGVLGLIPTLQCRLCLCLYHNECVGIPPQVNVQAYVCKNCQLEQETIVGAATHISPPPLTPAKQQPVLQQNLPKLQRIPKPSDITQPVLNTELPKLTPKPGIIIPTPITTQTENKSMLGSVTTWFPPSSTIQVGNNAGANSDGASEESRRPQLVEFVGNKKYLIVPRHNVLSVESVAANPPEKPTDTNPELVNVKVEPESPTKASDNMETDQVNPSKPTEITGPPEVTEEAPKHESPTNDERLEATPKRNTRSKNVPENEKSLEPMKFMDTYLQNLAFGYKTLLYVFQYLKVQDLLRAGCVCTMWRDVARHPILWNTVRMKNSQIHSFDGLANALSQHGTVHLDLRKMLLPTNGGDDIWPSFTNAIKKVESLRRIELCRCLASVVEELARGNHRLETIIAVTIKCESMTFEPFKNLKNLTDLRLKSTAGLSLKSDLSSLKELTQLKHLSITSIKDLNKLNIEVIGELANLEVLDIGECTDFPVHFGPDILIKLTKLEKLRLEKGQGDCYTFEILEAVKDLPHLQQLELVNFDIKAGFDKALGVCTNIKKLLIIPTYISQSATTNHMVLGGVLKLQKTLSHFVWGVTLELLRVTELFVDQCEQPDKKDTNKDKSINSGDSIPVLKPVPLHGIPQPEPSPSSDTPQVEILPLPNLQKLLLQNLPTTRVKILKIPFHATWRQSITDSVN